MAASIKIVNGALDEKDDKIVMRGVIAPESLRELQVPDYQREVLPITKINNLMEAMKSGTVMPDVELGMRGEKYMDRDGATYLQDSVYIIDGLQRITAGIQLIQNGGVAPRLGALIHFDTTEQWEKERFRILNLERTRLSTNVILRNMRTDSEAIALLYKLSTEDKTCAMYDRVCWSQRSQRQHLVSSLLFLKVAGKLHSRFGPGSSNHSQELAAGLEKIVKTVGKNTFRDNVRTFYEVLDECFHVRQVYFREGAAQMHGAFLLAFARVFARHSTFWRDMKFFVERPLILKLKGFPIRDPQVVSLSSSSGKASEMLYQLIVDHINSGKRTKRLKLAEGAANDELLEDGEFQSPEPADAVVTGK